MKQGSGYESIIRSVVIELFVAVGVEGDRKAAEDESSWRGARTRIARGVVQQQLELEQAMLHPSREQPPANRIRQRLLQPRRTSPRSKPLHRFVFANLCAHVVR